MESDLVQTPFQARFAVNLDGFATAHALQCFVVNLPRYGIPRAFRRYATYKVAAMSHRANGRIADAMVWEGYCETEYARLPSAWRW